MYSVTQSLPKVSKIVKQTCQMVCKHTIVYNQITANFPLYDAMIDILKSNHACAYISVRFILSPKSI